MVSCGLHSRQCRLQNRRALDDGREGRLFGDSEMLQRIIDSESPADAKKCGRMVRNFDADQWNAKAFDIVVAGNVHKFEQNPAMRDFLLSTGNAILVEAAPRDLIWGIGLGQDNERAKDPSKWRGRNQLGFALMTVRQRMTSRIGKPNLSITR